MVDRLFCSVFLQQQQQKANDELMRIGLEEPSPVDDGNHGIFSSIQRVRRSMGDSADRVLLLLFLMKSAERKLPTTDALSLNSTPIRSHHLFSTLSALPPTLQLRASSFFIPTLTHPDALTFIPPLGEMPVSHRYCCFSSSIC
jgi:hypothetical protein